MRKYFWGAAFLALAVATPWPARGDDRQIAKDIIQELQEHKDAGRLRGFNIDLQVDKGTVWLKGSVAKPEQKQLVLDIARRTDGVQQVVNELQLKANGEPVSDKPHPPAAPATVAAKPDSAKEAIKPQPAKAEIAKPEAPKAETLLSRFGFAKKETERDSNAAKESSPVPADNLSASMRREFSSRRPKEPGQDPVKAEVPTAVASAKPAFIPAPAKSELPISPPKVEMPALPKVEFVEKVQRTVIPAGGQFPVDPSQPSADDLDDQRLVGEIIAALEKCKQQGRLNDFDIDLKVVRGEAHLDGHVPNAQQHALVVETLKNLPGVNKVFDELEIRGGSPTQPQPQLQAPRAPTAINVGHSELAALPPNPARPPAAAPASSSEDQAIANTIVQKLQEQKATGKLKGFGIDMNVVNGDVWLKGHVANAEQKALALDIARRVPGVKQVVDDIVVKGETSSAPAPQQSGFSGALKRALGRADTASAKPAPAPSATLATKPATKPEKVTLLGMFRSREPAKSDTPAPNLVAQNANEKNLPPPTTTGKPPAVAPAIPPAAPPTTIAKALPAAAAPAQALATKTPATKTPAATPSRVAAAPAAVPAPNQVVAKPPVAKPSDVPANPVQPATVNATTPATPVAVASATMPLAKHESPAPTVVAKAEPSAEASRPVVLVPQAPAITLGAPSESTRPVTQIPTFVPKADDMNTKLVDAKQPDASQQAKPEVPVAPIPAVAPAPAVALPRAPVPSSTSVAAAPAAAPAKTAPALPPRNDWNPLASAAVQPNAAPKAATAPQPKTLVPRLAAAPQPQPQLATQAPRVPTAPKPTVQAAPEIGTAVAATPKAPERSVMAQPKTLPANNLATAKPVATASDAAAKPAATPAKATQAKAATPKAQAAAAQQVVAQQPVAPPMMMAPYAMPYMAPMPYGQAPIHFSPVPVGQWVPNQTPVAVAPAMSFTALAQAHQPMNGGGMAMPVNLPSAGGMAPARFDQPYMPQYAWPSYASYPNYAGVTYPKQYSPTAWPYIGPFYPYPQVPLGWRKVSLEWDDGWWMLDFKDK